MNHEIGSPKSFSDLEQQARRKAIDNIEKTLGISENEAPFHNRDDVNLTTLLIDEGRNDLAESLWTKPDKFKSDNTDLVSLGLDRVVIIFLNQEDWKRSKETLHKWNEAIEGAK